MSTVVTVSHIKIINPPEGFSYIEFLLGSQPNVLPLDTGDQPQPQATRSSIASPMEEMSTSGAAYLEASTSIEPASGGGTDRNSAVVEDNSSSGEEECVVEAPSAANATQTAAMSQQEMCGICLEASPDCQTPCHHVFHRECIGPWIIERFECSVCKRSIGMHSLSPYQ